MNTTLCVPDAAKLVNEDPVVVKLPCRLITPAVNRPAVLLPLNVTLPVTFNVSKLFCMVRVLPVDMSKLPLTLMTCPYKSKFAPVPEINTLPVALTSPDNDTEPVIEVFDILPCSVFAVPLMIKLPVELVILPKAFT